MMSVEERFNKKYFVDDSGCWVWEAAINWDGYGIFNDANNKTVRAHRFSYSLHIGEIPNGLVIDHLCKNIRCVNPNHLEAVTQGENFLRSSVIKKICKHGFPHTTCRNGCLTEYHREYKRKKRAEKI